MLLHVLMQASEIKEMLRREGKRHKTFMKSALGDGALMCSEDIQGPALLHSNIRRPRLKFTNWLKKIIIIIDLFLFVAVSLLTLSY